MASVNPKTTKGKDEGMKTIELTIYELCEEVDYWKA
jgi:hypothetical protein